MLLSRENYFDFKEVHGVPVLSSSFIKNALPINGGNVNRIRAAYNKDVADTSTRAKSFGSLVHLYAEDASNIVIMPEWKISTAVNNILTKAFKLIRDTRDEFPSNDMDVHTADLMTTADEEPWRASSSVEVRMKFLKEKGGEDYWKFMNDNRDKVALTGVDGQKVKDVVEGIRKAGLEIPLVKDDPTKQVLREFPVYFVLNGNYPCKILLDQLEIDDEKKEAVITDLKTSSDKVEHFISRYTYTPHPDTGIPEKVMMSGQYVKYKYFLQELFYKIGVSQYLKDIGKENYIVKFRFGVVETTAPFCAKMISSPVVWGPVANNEFTEAMLIVEDWFRQDKFLTF